MQDEQNIPTDGGNLARVYGPGRDPKTGLFTKDHTFSVKHGLFSERDLMNLRAEVGAMLDAAFADDGGEDNITANRRALHELLARLRRRFDQLDNALEVKGLFDGKGRLRQSWLQRLEGLAAQITRVVDKLGMERRAKPVKSFEAIVAERFGGGNGKAAQ